jgi:hypothetical protein
MTYSPASGLTGRPGDAVNDQVGRHDHQLSRPCLTSGPPAVGEYHQTIAPEQQLTPHPSGRDRVVSGYITHNPADIGQSLGTPDDRQQLARISHRPQT